jgi:hypothetical protein
MGDPVPTSATTVTATAFQEPQINVFGPYGLRPQITRSGTNGSTFTFLTKRYSGNSGLALGDATMRVIYIIDGVEVTGPVLAGTLLTITLNNVEHKWHWGSLIVYDAATPTNYVPEAILFNTTTTLYY